MKEGIKTITIRTNGLQQYGVNLFQVTDLKLESVLCGGDVPTIDKLEFESEKELIEYLFKYASGMHSKLGLSIEINKPYEHTNFN